MVAGTRLGLSTSRRSQIVSSNFSRLCCGATKFKHCEGYRRVRGDGREEVLSDATFWSPVGRPATIACLQQCRREGVPMETERSRTARHLSGAEPDHAGQADGNRRQL